jgi:hypothetical protein
MKSMQWALTLLLLTVLLFTSAAGAQTGTPLIRVAVPFDFQVGNKLLPAGDYLIARAESYFLVVRDSNERVVAMVVTTPAQALTAPPVSKLVFRVDGGRNVLTRVWTSSSRYGYELPPPRTRAVFAKTPSTEMQVTAGK